MSLHPSLCPKQPFPIPQRHPNDGPKGRIRGLHLSFCLTLLGILFFAIPAHADTPSDKDKDLNSLSALPTTFHDIALETSPSGLIVELAQDKQPLRCHPANVTPCKFRVVGYKTVTLHVSISYRNQKIRYVRELKGRKPGIQQWLLPMPLLPATPAVTKRPSPRSSSLPARPTPVRQQLPPVERRASPLSQKVPANPPPEQRPPIRREKFVQPPPKRVAQVVSRPPLQKTSAKPMIWPWIVVGVAVAAGVGVGVGVALAQQDRIAWRCTACLK